MGSNINRSLDVTHIVLSTQVQRVGDMAPHKICQHAFKKNDIVWICKQCQKDETCVLCNNCFRDSCHEGHEVYFYHTQVRRAFE